MQNQPLKYISRPAYDSMKSVFIFIFLVSIRFLSFDFRVQESGIYAKYASPSFSSNWSTHKEMILTHHLQELQWHFQVMPKTFLDKNDWHIYSFQFMKQKFTPIIVNIFETFQTFNTNPRWTPNNELFIRESDHTLNKHPC